MVTEVRLHVEGGGDKRYGKDSLREGFHGFLEPLITAARQRRISLRIIPCGGRTKAWEQFQWSLEAYPDALNLLLVDAEGPVTSLPGAHLSARDGWPCSASMNNRYHLMVQTMEAWLIADVDALRRYYGDDFNRGAIPGNPRVEEISKEHVESAQSSSRWTAPLSPYPGDPHAH